MKELFLLGAGASVEAGVPDTYNMTRKMLENFSENGNSRYQEYAKVLNFVISGLIFKQGIEGNSPFDGVNIEDLFTAVNLLGDRENSELSPFISAWHPKLMGLESGELGSFKSKKLLRTINEPIEEFVREKINEALRFIGGSDFPVNHTTKINDILLYTNFERVFTDAVRRIVSGSKGLLFTDTAKAMMQNLVEMVWIREEKKVEYLIPLLEGIATFRSSIVTLNYDNTIELVGQLQNIPINTGFDVWSDTGEFNFTIGSVPLIKLHGSIDWRLSDGQITNEKPLSYQIIDEVNLGMKKQPNYNPAVIFGGKNKLTAKGPFLSLLRAFEKELMTSQLLTIIGYSFRDEHVNEYIANWFNGWVSRRIRIINPSLESLNHKFVNPLLNGQAKDRVKMIREKASVGIQRITKIF